MLKKIISLFKGNKKQPPAASLATPPAAKAEEPPVHVVSTTSQGTAAAQFSPPKSKPETPVKTEATPKPIDYSKFIHLGEKFIRVTDHHGSLDSLPDNFFEAYEKLESVYLYLPKVQDLPASLGRLTMLASLDIHCPKLKQLPAFIAGFENLQHLQINCPQMRLDEQSLALCQLKSLSRLTLSGYYGNKWPAFLEKLTQLHYLNITIDSKKTDQLEMIRSIGRMKWLTEVSFRGGINLEQIGGEIIAFDHLESASLWDTNPVTRPDFLNWGLLRHVSLRSPYKAGEMTFDDFKSAIQHDDFDDDTRRLLFGFFAKQYTVIKALLPNWLLAAHGNGQGAALFFEYKPAKGFLERLKQQTSNSNIRIATKRGPNCYHIVGKETPFEQVLELVRQAKPLLLEDHVKEWLTALEDPWLMQSESQEANEQVYRLLTSHQAENYLLAFQIIEGGGANNELVSMIAAVMLTHPDTKVAKTAEKLFAKIGPSTTLNAIKQKKISLRRSGDTVKKLNCLFQTDIGIPAIPFRLMHGLIAGENPVIKDVQPGELSFKDFQFNEPFPDCGRFFEHFSSVDFSGSKGLDIDGPLRSIVHWPALERLNFSGCHYTIPAQLADFKSLSRLNLSSNTLENPAAMKGMTKLWDLNVEGCKITDWEWLNGMNSLDELNMGRNDLKEVPKAVFSLTALRVLSLKQNKLKSIEPGLFSLSNLIDLDLSNNQISELDYRLFSQLPLKKLALRSNKISKFNPKEALAVSSVRGNGLVELNISSNALEVFKVVEKLFPHLISLDISKNKLTEMDNSIFQFTAVKNLFASDNRISEIPPSIAGKSMQKLSLEKNQIKELPEHFSTTKVEYCDLRFNQIASIPASFKRKSSNDYSKVYWNLEGNPVGKFGLFQ